MISHLVPFGTFPSSIDTSHDQFNAFSGFVRSLMSHWSSVVPRRCTTCVLPPPETNKNNFQNCDCDRAVMTVKHIKITYHNDITSFLPRSGYGKTSTKTNANNRIFSVNFSTGLMTEAFLVGEDLKIVTLEQHFRGIITGQTVGDEISQYLLSRNLSLKRHWDLVWLFAFFILSQGRFQSFNSGDNLFWWDSKKHRIIFKFCLWTSAPTRDG